VSERGALGWPLTHFTQTGRKQVDLLVAHVTMSDEEEIEHYAPSGIRHFDMNEAFCARMLKAIEAGLENAPIGVVTTPGTQHPKRISAEPRRLPASPLGNTN